MSLVAACLQCGSRFAAPSHLAGTTVACPNCHAPIQVPLETPPARKKKRMRWALPVSPPPPPAGEPVYAVADHDPSQAPVPPPVASSSSDGQQGEHPLLLMPSRSGKEEELVDLTAMVDIVFFLLIFFLVTSLQALEAVIDLPSPRSDEGAATQRADAIDYRNDPNYLVVVIDEENNVWLDDEVVSGEAGLRAMLRSAVDAGEQRRGMLVIGSADATHGKLVMVLDSAAEAGINELLFAVTEDPNAL